MFSNRIITSISLIAGFALVAVGRQAVVPNTATNVLVTNTSTQAVPTAVVNTPNVHSYITNTTANPVPVSAPTALPTSVVNTPNVHANITNTQASPVNSFVTNSASFPVNSYITNSTASPVNANITNSSLNANISNPASAPAMTELAGEHNVYQQRVEVDVSVANAANNYQLGTGSASQRLVIDWVGGFSSTSSNGDYCTLAEIEVLPYGGGSVLAQLDLPMSGVPGQPTLSAGSMQTHLTLEPGQSMYIIAQRGWSYTTGTAAAFITIQGHYVNVP